MARGRAARGPPSDRPPERRSAPRQHEPPNRHVDRPCHPPRAARRRELPDRPDLGEPQRSVQRARRRWALHAAGHRVRRSAANRLRPDLARSLRPSRRADRQASRPRVQPALRGAARHQEMARGSAHHERGRAELGRIGEDRRRDDRVHAGAAWLRPDARRSGTPVVGVVGRARLPALLLRRRHGLLPPLQGHRRGARPLRPGRAPDRLLYASRARQAGPPVAGRRALR